MSSIIYAGTKTTHSHGLFLSWLNGLLEEYVSGFYDDAVSNILKLSFIREHYLFLQEQYNSKGTGNQLNFITVLPTDSTQSILMVHDMTGKPFLYNKTDISNILEFTPEGVIKNFFENVNIPIYDESGDEYGSLFITFKQFFGIKAPMLVLKNFNNTIISTGLLDCDYETRTSGSYSIQTTPLRDVNQLIITNISKLAMKLSIPILPKLSLEYTIEPSKSIIVPNTELSDYFVRNNIDKESLTYKEKNY